MWFEKLVGFRETKENVYKNLKIENTKLISLVNKKEFEIGELEIVSLKELKEKITQNLSKNKIEQIIADVKELHKNPQNENTLFQVASQFNLLEMVSPNITPEMGVDRYENDFTQGPTCAIACGAGTIYRNYFVKLNNQIGQTENIQIDCSEEIGELLDNKNNNLWQVKNGYLLFENVEKLNQILQNFDKEEIKNSLKVGIMWGSEVTISEIKYKVSQIYCSALPISYNYYNKDELEKFAKIILEAAYEATICAGILNYLKTGNNRLYLTLLGGGAFGNRIEWIIEAIEKTLKKYSNSGLDIKVVSFRNRNYDIEEMIERLGK